MNGRRILVAGGMLLVFAGLLYAAGYMFWFARALEKSEVIALELALDMAGKGRMETARGYARELAALHQRQWGHWLAAGHLAGAGLIAMTVSSFIGALELKKKWIKILSYLLIFGGVLSAAGYFTSWPGYGRLSILGYLWQLSALSGFIIAFVLHAIAKSD